MAELSDFDKGRVQARKASKMECFTPNWDAIKAQGPAFAEGFRYEWTACQDGRTTVTAFLII